ncbi:tagatose kinase [Gluconobacter thailandicus]|uniref:Sugar kinase n=1 Tax=Gluconobacter thailandicus TaxID=257438 RepID=A0AAP9EQ69_GLUTH|nr:sugar kinase [Gluconobacter thailandicus]QEH95261.1 sugar kinase [Gluconobacter thailandicus]
MKILTIGELIVEITATTRGDRFLEPQPLFGPFPSGAPAIFISQVARFGVPCAMIACVGDDDFGKLNIDRLRADGVDVSAIATLPGECTGSAFVRYNTAGGRHFVFNIEKSASGRISSTPATEAAIKGSSHLHIMGTALSVAATRDMVLHAMARIKAHGGTVSFDPNVRPELLRDRSAEATMRRVLAETDIFLPSGDELFTFVDAPNEEEAVRALHQAGVGVVVVKRGAEGATLFDAAGRYDVAPIAVEEVDPTGAGDCFGAAFVGAWLSGFRREAALAYANAAGAACVTRVGPMEGALTRAELDGFLHHAAGIGAL